MAAAPRKAVDKRKVGSAKNPTKVKTPSSSTYKPPAVPQVVKGKAGRPKKAR